MGNEAAGAGGFNWLIESEGREEGDTDVDCSANTLSRQPAPEMIRHVINVIMRTAPLTGKVWSRGRRMSTGDHRCG